MLRPHSSTTVRNQEHLLGQPGESAQLIAMSNPRKVQDLDLHGRDADTDDAWTAGEALARLLRVLGDPTRLRLYLLLRRGEACVCELAAELDIAENLVSHHLGVLRRARLVQDRRDPSDARWVYYQLDGVEFGRISTVLGTLFDPQTIGTRTPTCGPAAVGASQLPQPPIMPRRRSATAYDHRSARSPST